MTHVTLTREEGARTLLMRDGGKFNPGSLAAFNDALDAVIADTEADLLVITGEGKHFSQGLDLDYLMAGPDGALEFVGDCMRMVGRLLTWPLPVVAAVNGHAFGLGAMITLASDYKVMRRDRGYFCLPEIDLGMTLTERMNALVCGKLSGNALRDVLLTGKRITGPEAVSLGIVDATAAVDEFGRIAAELAAPMRGKNRQALSGLKRGINATILAAIEADVPDLVIQGDPP